jgi:hypothetical protein
VASFDADYARPTQEQLASNCLPKSLLCWGFDVQLLAEAYGGYYEAGVFKALLTGLKELSESKNRRKREREFLICGGYYLHDTFWIGVSSSLNADVANILAHHLREVVGYDSQEYSDSTLLPFVALFKYEYGLIIEYSTVAYGECSDAYGSGVKVNYQLLRE